MTDEDKKQPQGPRAISRRDFALGSVGILGAYSIAESAPLPPLSAEAQSVKLEKSGLVQDLMVARHILDDDLKRVIDHAERTGEKLYQPGTSRFLSKLRVKEAYFYVEYEPVADGYRVHTAYSHRFLLGEDAQ
jgi:hypothetical protein